VRLTVANLHDSMVFEELLEDAGPIKRPCGRPRKRPDKLHTDKAYDDKKCTRALGKRGIKRRIARKGLESTEKLGKYRWVVERILLESRWSLLWQRLRRQTLRSSRLGPACRYCSHL
jgi:hypothetical protein